jgi:hypothetical protein
MAIFNLKNYGMKVRKKIPYESDELHSGSYWQWFADAVDEQDAQRKVLLKFTPGHEVYDVWKYSDTAQEY